MSRLRFSMAHEVLDAFPSARRDLGADLPDAEPLAYLDALAASPAPEAALFFCAYLLPRREAVWWGCRCLRDFGPAPGRDPADAALAAAEAWVRRPDDGLRRAALTLALDSDLARPSQWMALAAGWAGGSMAPGEHAVATPPHLTARAIRAGLLIALGQDDPARRRPSGRRMTDLGRRVVSGEDVL